MDFSTALTFQFRDPDWIKKILIVSLISLIPFVGGIFVYGWSLEITRRVIRNDPEPLPNLDIASDLVGGIKGMVIYLVYSLPVLLVAVPLGTLIAITGTTSDIRLVTGIDMVAAFVIAGASILYGFILMFILPAALGRISKEEGTLNDAFNLKAIFNSLKAAPTAYILVVLGQFLAGFIASMGTVACFVGVIATSVYSMSIMGHLYGQAFKESQMANSIRSLSQNTNI